MREFPGWPKMWRDKSGSYRISGRCATARRCTAAITVATGLLRFCGFAMIAAAFVVLAPALLDGRKVPAALDFGLDALVGLRIGVRELLTIHLPAAGRALRYDGRSPIDWHLAGAGIVLLLGTRPLAWCAAHGLGLLFPPLLRRRFAVTVSTDQVRIHGRFFGRTFRRGNGVCDTVAFRLRRTQEHLARPNTRPDGPALFPELRQQPAFVELLHGKRRIKWLYVRSADQGEAIVGRCSEALALTTKLMPPGIE